jgi:hypothetical protein
MKHTCIVTGSRPLSRSGVWDHVQLQEVVDAQKAENRAFDNPDLLRVSSRNSRGAVSSICLPPVTSSHPPDASTFLTQSVSGP